MVENVAVGIDVYLFRQCSPHLLLLLSFGLGNDSFAFAGLLLFRDFVMHNLVDLQHLF